MNIFLIAVMMILLLCLLGGFLCVLKGADNANRMLALQLSGTLGVTLVIILALIQNNELLINLALILTLLASVTVIAFLKLAERSDRLARNADE